MAIKRNTLRFFCVFAWALFCVVISEEQGSGDVPYQNKNLKSIQVQESTSENIIITPEANVSLTTAASPMNMTTSKSSTLITMLTSSPKNLTTDQSSTVKDYVTNSTKELRSTTLLAVTKSTEKSSSTTSLAETSTLLAETTAKHLTAAPKTEEWDKKNTEILIRLNGYKIATFCLAAVLAIVLLIILIYFSAKSKTGHGEITSPPVTPPQDVEDYQKDQEPRVVRLSSYFPYAVDTLPKDDINENGIDDDRRVTTFLTKKNKPQEDATGSRDKILHTSEL